MDSRPRNHFMDVTSRVTGLTDALHQLDKLDPETRKGIRRALYRIGATVKRVAVAYAPISPSTGMLRKFAKLGGLAGQKYLIPATKNGKRGPLEVSLTKFYADRLASDFYGLDNKLSSKPRPMPGGLMRSIMFTSDDQKAEIFVPSNSPAGTYAKRIHDERGVTWRHLGPGSQAKGSQARERFIARAIDDNVQPVLRIVQDEINKATSRATGGV